MRVIHTFRNVSGHSLVEVLTVVAMLVALIALLMPVLNKGKRNAYTTTCMTNLKQLSQAHQAVMVRDNMEMRQVDRMTQASIWPGLLYDNEMLKENLKCPEAGPSEKGDADMEQLMIAMTKKGDFNNILYYQSLNPSDPWVRKLSWTQWLDATGGTGKFESGDFKNFFKKRYKEGYVPDEAPERYVLMVEDYSGIVSGKWVNYTDFIIFVDKNPQDYDSSLINAQHGYTSSSDRGYLVWADSKKPVYSPNTQLVRNDARTVGIPRYAVHYAANPKQIFRQTADDNRILFLDYEEPLATPINWEDHYGEDGELTFVRHLNRTMNVALVDGSALITHESKIRLSQFSKENMYW